MDSQFGWFESLVGIRIPEGSVASPLDGASERSSLGYRGILSRRDSFEGVPQVMRRNFGLVPVIIYPAVVDELSLFVEDEGLRCADSGERSGQGLVFIPDVRKVEPFLLCSLDHALVAIFRIVRINRDEGDASIHEVALDCNHAILVGLHVRAMIA